MDRPNAFNARFEDKYDAADPEHYRVAEAPFGQAAGGRELTVRLYELPTGQRMCPYHYEHVEEWLLVVAGDVQVRTPRGIDSAVAGDLICFPAGPDGAHQVYNEMVAPARVVMFSAATEPAVCVYPDSDKVGVWIDDKQWMFRGAEGHLDYFDGEPTPPTQPQS
jgi:uncharacterized cupin superfamily protein